MRKKKEGVFTVVVNNVLGINLIAGGFIQDINGDYIEETRLYRYEENRAFKNIIPEKNKKGRLKATLRATP